MSYKITAKNLKLKIYFIRRSNCELDRSATVLPYYKILNLNYCSESPVTTTSTRRSGAKQSIRAFLPLTVSHLLPVTGEALPLPSETLAEMPLFCNSVVTASARFCDNLEL